MSRAVLTLSNLTVRQRAKHWIDIAEDKTRVEFKKPRRTLDQNAKFWPMLGDISRQHLHHGVRLAPDAWKLLFLDALGQELQLVPNLAGNGFVGIGRSSSDLTVGEMSAMIELMYAWGADPAHLVIWSEPERWGVAA